ncbi:Hsp20 family protein [Roseomonas sp. NAR14]|uniref:Hsp20 family protein n=1 Tax=Roseomonas acroporae TaxID=2937791 RepID=A0A9X1YCC5_9PROT|nr:Hsp20 family protein [Roseomonas acroporae]MCK8786548.1 Hsp20 family protein [Roseomonas acroporae]
MELTDLAPLARSSIGFDRLLKLLEGSRLPEPADDYPPYNIEKTGQDAYRITLAVAGFGPDDLDIILQPNLLAVSGKKADSEARGKGFLYQGMIQRPFRRVFHLADYVQVRGAELKDGMLVIDLAREIPDAMKPRRIEIAGGQARPAQIDTGHGG